MVELSRPPRLHALLRSFLIQGSWNYRTLQGTGLAYALIPLLARVYRADPTALTAALARHARFFNANPYLSTVAIAAIARMEAEGAGLEDVERFKRALVSPLGSLGDRLIWARWRPFCSFLALLLFAVGAPWYVAVGAFLLFYNTAQLALRSWGFRLGWREGRDVGRALMASPLRRLPDRLTIPLALTSGALLPPLAMALGDASGAGPVPVVAAALALVAAGYQRPAAAGRLAALGLLLASLAFVGLETTVW